MDLFKFLLKTTLAALIMGIVLYLSNRIIPIDVAAKFTLKGKITELCYLALEVFLGATSYFVIILIMKVPEGNYIMDIFLKKIKFYKKLKTN